MSDFGMSKEGIAIVMLIPAIIGMTSRVPLSILSKKYNYTTFIPFMYVIQIIYLLLYSLIRDPIVFYLTIGFSALAWSGFGPAAISLIETHIPDGKRSIIFGYYYTMSGLGQFFGTIILSIFIIHLSFRDIFLMSSIFPIIGLICSTFLWWRRKTQKIEFTNKINQKSNIQLNMKFKQSLLHIFSNKKITILYLCRIIFFFSMSIFQILFSLYLYEVLNFNPIIISSLFSLKAFMSLITRLPAGFLSNKIGVVYSYFLAYVFVASGFF